MVPNISDTETRLGELVAADLARAGISTREAEARTGIPRTTLARRLGRGDFTVAELERLAELLSTSVADLVARAQGRAA